jgi:hypothetical protein
MDFSSHIKTFVLNRERAISSLPRFNPANIRSGIDRYDSPSHAMTQEKSHTAFIFSANPFKHKNRHCVDHDDQTIVSFDAEQDALQRI